MRYISRASGYCALTSRYWRIIGVRVVTGEVTDIGGKYSGGAFRGCLRWRKREKKKRTSRTARTPHRGWGWSVCVRVRPCTSLPSSRSFHPSPPPGHILLTHARPDPPPRYRLAPGERSRGPSRRGGGGAVGGDRALVRPAAADDPRGAGRGGPDPRRPRRDRRAARPGELHGRADRPRHRARLPPGAGPAASRTPDLAGGPGGGGPGRTGAIVAVVDALRGDWSAQAFAPDRCRGPWASRSSSPAAELPRLAAGRPGAVVGFGVSRLAGLPGWPPDLRLVEPGPLAPAALRLASAPDTAWDPWLLTQPLYSRPAGLHAARPGPLDRRSGGLTCSP